MVKLVKIRSTKDSASGIFFPDTLASREVLCDSAPGLLALSNTYFHAVPRECKEYRSEVVEKWHNPRIPPSRRKGLITRSSGPCPFYVPGGRFNEMYGWDSYFIAKGLILSGELAEAFCIAENLRYQIEAYGKILNANRTYYLFRGNPPLFSTLIVELLDHLAEEEKSSLSDWIESAVDAMIKEYHYFHRGYNEDLGLTRHTPGGKGIPMETEEGHFFSIIRAIVPGSREWTTEELNDYIRKYNKGEVVSAELEEYLQNDRVVRESGHDTSKRVDGIGSYLYTVDLNSLLYKTEQDILSLRYVEGIERISVRRKAAINTLLWSGDFYYDYNAKENRLSSYKGATALYPLFSRAADEEKARVLIRGLDDLIGVGGIFGGSRESCIGSRGQWDHPYGWAPHQILGWIGLVHYKEEKLAKSLALRWCTMIGRIFSRYNGVVTEKYNVEESTHKVTVEYGNIGTEIKYVPREGFGWTNTSWLVGLALLSEKEKRELYARIIL